MKLKGKKVAILATDGFEKSELTSPRLALLEAGATAHIVAPDDQGKGSIRSWDKTDWGSSFDIDKKLSDATESEYDALMLPGGAINPDQLRMNKQAIEFIRKFFTAGKPVAAICHAPSLLAEAGVIEGRTLTSYPSIRTDLKNAGANVVDKEVVVDKGLVTSRDPDDLPAFNRMMVEEIAEGVHKQQAATV